LTSRVHAPFFYVPKHPVDDDHIVISGEQSRHLALVRRARAGDVVHVSDGEGCVMDVVLDSVTLESATGKVMLRTDVERPSFEVTVLQGLAKGSKLDFVIQKLIEIGVDRVCVFGAGRSVPKWDEMKAERALERWRAIALEASKQSRRAWLPQILGPAGRDEAIGLIQGCDVALVAHESAGERLKERLDAIKTAKLSCCLVVGPEGGLTPDEVDSFQRVGGKAVSLGSQILRTDTAAFVLASIVMYEVGRLGGP
jgi:16S rRNA (uracil1498-N3)-methyltransferase